MLVETRDVWPGAFSVLVAESEAETPKGSPRSAMVSELWLKLSESIRTMLDDNSLSMPAKVAKFRELLLASERAAAEIIKAEQTLKVESAGRIGLDTPLAEVHRLLDVSDGSQSVLATEGGPKINLNTTLDDVLRACE